MKTRLNAFTQRPRRSTSLWCMAALFTALGAGLGAPAGLDDDNECPPCKATARFVRQAALSEAQSDYWLEVARASTLPSASERKAAIKQAQSNRKENVAVSEEQYQARLSLCQLLGETCYHPVIKPTDFLTPAETAANPNRYLPLKPGTTFRYRGETSEGTESNVVMVTHETKQILGVTCTVVIDIVY